MKRYFLFILIILLHACVLGQNKEMRRQKDTIGFASKAWQMDSVMKRINRDYSKYYDSLYLTQKVQTDQPVRFAICPHDDYTYAGFMYNEVFSHVHAKTIIIFGVAHKAKKFGIEQKIVFDDFEYWQGAYGKIKISPLRQQIMKALPNEDYTVHDSLQIEEHSTEAFIPFLQYYDRNVDIISILVPYMSFDKMQKISSDLAAAIFRITQSQNLKWGADIALIASTDAVHYGDEDWGGSNYAPFGCDNKGYAKAMEKEKSIMNDCLKSVDTSSAKRYYSNTVQAADWHQYKWTWCGRYSVPFAMLTAYKLLQLSGLQELNPEISDYSNSIDHKPLKVDDVEMGATAPANMHHWVGYSVEVYY